MKKYGKLLIIGLTAFFISMMPVLAKNVKLSDLEKEVDKIYPQEDHDIQDIFIIGKYAFTSEHVLTTQDVMLAARSIIEEDKTGETKSDAIYNEMTISHLTRRYESGKYTNWSDDTPIIGTSKIDNDETIDIRYIDYNFLPEETNFSITTDLTGKDDYVKVLQDALKFEANESYENGKLENKDGKLTGLLLKNEKITLNADDKKKFNNPVYFFAYVLEIEGADKNTTIKLDGMNGTGEILWKDFDVTPEKENGKDKTPGIVVLVPVDPTKLSQNPKITITVDKDGSGKEYAPNKYDFDLTELTIQEASKVTVDINKASDADKNTMKGWGYEPELNKELSLDKEGNLQGILVNQTLKDNVFKENEGYYFDFTFITPDGVSKEDAKIRQIDKEGKLIKEFKPGEFDNDNNLTILFQFSKEQKKCEENSDNCKIYYTVDFDGDKNKYFPTTYVIDYSKVKFEKLSEVSISEVEESSYDDQKWHGWDMPENYETKFTYDEENPLVVKVTGLIPIDKNAFEEGQDPFTGDTYGYYLAFKLTKKEGSPSDEINVKFLQGDGHEDETEVITNTDFGNGNGLYVLKYINANDNNTDKKKQFDVVVDLDDEDENYAPYTITIDWSELDFQSESFYTNAHVVNIQDTESNQEGYISQADKQQITGWGYDFENMGEDLKLEVSNGHYTLSGKVKEQSVDAGFKSKEGYYVPIKIYGPTNENISGSHYLTTEGNNKWTVELNTEDNTTKIVTPSADDYKNGFTTVLFKLRNDSEEKKITYKIDFDGAGNYFLPYEETINYDGLELLSKNTITYKYTDKNGKPKTVTETVYEGEQILNKELEKEQSDYRKLEGWYNTDEKVVLPKQSGEDEDLSLEAHWNLNVEKFMDDVVTDLNNPDSTYSDDFTDKFELVQGVENKNEITIKVKSPNVSLSTLSETSIPGAIAYVLEKGEIKDVTLTVGDDTTKKFDKNSVSTVSTKVKSSSALDETGEAIKAKVIKEAKDAFNTELKKLDGTEKDATMDQVEFVGTKFTLKVGEAANDTVKLVNNAGEALDGNDTYTFKFDSDFAVIDQNDKLGPNSIKEVLDKNSYDTIYIDGDLTEKQTIEITAQKDVTIEPVKNFSKTMITAETPEHFIKVEEGQNYAIDVKAGNGNVTISDLKVTGGKFGEIKIEKGATVTANNIDVSGKIEPSQKSDNADDMHAAILVDGVLTASNIKNSDEKYSTPTIALVTSYSYPGADVTGEDEDHGESDNVTSKAKVTIPSKDMTKNDKYYIVKSNTEKHVDSVEESYYGSFYYVNSNNSQIYFMTIIDREISSGGITYFKIYNYDDEIDIESLGYTKDLVGKTNNDKKFDKLRVESSGKTIEQNDKVQNVLLAHITNKVVADYK